MAKPSKIEPPGSKLVVVKSDHLAVRRRELSAELEKRTKVELYERSQKLYIAGRSHMSKGDLVVAIAAAMAAHEQRWKERNEKTTPDMDPLTTPPVEDGPVEPGWKQPPKTPFIDRLIEGNRLMAYPLGSLALSFIVCGALWYGTTDLAGESTNIFGHTTEFGIRVSDATFRSAIQAVSAAASVVTGVLTVLLFILKAISVWLQDRI